MLRHSTLATTFAISVLLSACGGSGSSSSPAPIDDDPAGDATGGTTAATTDGGATGDGEGTAGGGDTSGAGGTAGGGDTATTAGTTTATPGGDTGGTAGGDTGTGDGTATGGTGGDTGGDGGEGPVPAQPASGDPVVNLEGGREARVLATSNGPVIGVPGATMRAIESRDVHSAGFVVYSGSYVTSASGFSTIQGLWAGPVREPSLVLGGNAEIAGLPATVRFAGTESVSVASDGSIAARVRLGGSRETRALVVASGGAPALLAETGVTLSGLTDEKTVSSFDAVARGAGWTVFEAETDGGGRALWLAGADGITAIAEHADRDVNNAPRLGDCRVFVDRFGNSDAPSVLDDGTVVFHATLGTYTRDQLCTDGKAVVRYEGGSFTNVVSPGDIVPGTTTSTFGDIRLLGVTDSDAVVVGATLSTPIGGSRPDTRWSYWLYPPTGSPRLIALQGEEVQLNGTTETFSGNERSLDVNAAGQVALRTTFDDRNRGAALFGGTPHAGQPHAAVSAPGASSLTFLLDPTVTVPAPYVASTFFSLIGRPAVDASGQVVFFGRVTDSELDRTVVDALWRSDLEGNLVTLIDEGDVAPVAGVEQPLTTLLQLNRSSYRVDELRIDPLSNGGFLLAENVRFGGTDTLVYLGPETAP